MNYFQNYFREWEMSRAFQTAINIHKPELVFILGKLIFITESNCIINNFYMKKKN